MQVARASAGGEALMAITVDSPVADAIVSAVAKETGADLVRSVTLVN
jgi:D-3-phosphoglycerate dehydrogenase